MYVSACMCLCVFFWYLGTCVNGVRLSLHCYCCSDNERHTHTFPLPNQEEILHLSCRCVCVCTCPAVLLSAWIKPHNWWGGGEKQRPTTYLTMMQASQDIQTRCRKRKPKWMEWWQNERTRGWTGRKMSRVGFSRRLWRIRNAVDKKQSSTQMHIGKEETG